jgi:hypothetical protein
MTTLLKALKGMIKYTDVLYDGPHAMSLGLLIANEEDQPSAWDDSCYRASKAGITQDGDLLWTVKRS